MKLLNLRLANFEVNLNEHVFSWLLFRAFVNKVAHMQSIFLDWETEPEAEGID